MIMPEGYSDATKQEALARYIYRHVGYMGFATLKDFHDSLKHVDMDRQMELFGAAAFADHNHLSTMDTYRFVFQLFVTQDDETTKDVAEFLLDSGDAYAEKLSEIAAEIEAENANEEPGA